MSLNILFVFLEYPLVCVDVVAVISVLVIVVAVNVVVVALLDVTDHIILSWLQ